MASKKTTTGGFALETSASHLIHRAQQIAALQSAEVLKQAGITLRQFSVLAAVSDSEGASQADIVERTGIDRSTLADMVSRMEDSGLLKRRPSKQDKRAKSVSLMAKGRKAFEVTRDGVAKADEELLALLPSNRRSAFISALSKLSDAEFVPTAPVAPPAEAPKKKKAAKPKAKPKAAFKAKPKTARKKPAAKKKTAAKRKKT